MSLAQPAGAVVRLVTKRSTPRPRGWRMRLSTAIGEFTQEVRMSRSPATASAYNTDLNRLRALCRHDTVLEVTPDLVSRYFTNASEDGLKMATLHRKAAALREFARWGLQRGLWAQDPTARLPRIKRPEAMPRPFSEEEAGRLWALELPGQDALLRAVLFYTGLRVTPVCGIKLGDISEAPPSIRCTVKGAKVQVVRLHPDLARLVAEFVLANRDRRRPQDHLFQRGDGRPLHRRLVERMTARWGAAAGVPDCTPHRFRHSFATQALRTGSDLRVIQQMLGHADIKSTTVYTKVYDSQIDTALSKLGWPS